MLMQFLLNSSGAASRMLRVATFVNAVTRTAGIPSERYLEPTVFGSFGSLFMRRSSCRMTRWVVVLPEPALPIKTNDLPLNASLTASCWLSLRSSKETSLLSLLPVSATVTSPVLALRLTATMGLEEEAEEIAMDLITTVFDGKLEIPVSLNRIVRYSFSAGLTKEEVNYEIKWLVLTLAILVCLK